jgi:hypothetical protein
MRAILKGGDVTRQDALLAVRKIGLLLATYSPELHTIVNKERSLINPLLAQIAAGGDNDPAFTMPSSVDPLTLLIWAFVDVPRSEQSTREEFSSISGTMMQLVAKGSTHLLTAAMAKFTLVMVAVQALKLDPPPGSLIFGSIAAHLGKPAKSASKNFKDALASVTSNTESFYDLNPPFPDSTSSHDMYNALKSGLERQVERESSAASAADAFLAELDAEEAAKNKKKKPKKKKKKKTAEPSAEQVDDGLTDFQRWELSEAAAALEARKRQKNLDDAARVRASSGVRSGRCC